MVKKKKKLLIRVIKFFIIPFILLFLSFLLSGFTSLTMDASFTVLPANHYTNVTIQPQTTRLFKDHKIQGTFTAKENNLGSVAVKLKNYNEGNSKDGRKLVKEDKIIFRLKELGQKTWYYENEYNGGQFHELNFFPFGFPSISDSKDRKYTFEIISKEGNYENVLTLTDGYPLLKTNYKFEKSVLLHDRGLLLHFLTQKQLYAFTIIDYYFALIIFLLPFFLYLLCISPFGGIVGYPARIVYNKFTKFLTNKYFTFIKNHFRKVTSYEMLILLGIVLDIFFIRFTNHLILILLITLWLLQIVVRKIESKISFSIAFILLCLCSVSFIFHNQIQTEKIAIWVFYFMLIGSIQSLIEIKVFRK